MLLISQNLWDKMDPWKKAIIHNTPFISLNHENLQECSIDNENGIIRAYIAAAPGFRYEKDFPLLFGYYDPQLSKTENLKLYLKRYLKKPRILYISELLKNNLISENDLIITEY